MNRKRQTIWLVSMLSIMVILSAYYLFTDDVKEKTDVAAEAEGDWNEVVVDMLREGGFDPSIGKSDAQGTQDGVGVDVGAMTEMDRKALEEYKSVPVSGMEYFIGLEMQREEDYFAKKEDLQAVASDATKSDKEVSAAISEISRLDKQFERIDAIEDQLRSSYSNAIVLRDESQFKVVVQADALQKSEALGIIELVMKELEVGPDQVRVVQKP